MTSHDVLILCTLTKERTRRIHFVLIINYIKLEGARYFVPLFTEVCNETTMPCSL